MEIILKRDVENLGYQDDIVTVKNGYARNFLIPKGYAVMADTGSKKMLEENLKQRRHKEAKEIEEAEKTAEKLQGLDLKIPAKVGRGNKLFGSVNKANLAEELSKQGYHIDKKYVNIQGGAVKATGPYVAHIRLHREVNVNLDFEVISDGSK